MGKKAKEHRKKVAKRNANIAQQQQRMKKIWQDAFQEQMDVMKEKFENEKNIDTINEKLESLEGTINNLDDSKIDELQTKIKEISNILSETKEDVIEVNTTELQNEEEKDVQERPESIEPIQGNQTI